MADNSDQVAALAIAYYAAQTALNQAASSYVLSLWTAVDGTHPTVSWVEQRVGDKAFVAVSQAQLAAAQGAEQFVTRAVRAQETVPAPQGALEPRSLAGIASDGRELETLLVRPLIQTEVALSQGATAVQAHAVGASSLDTIVRTQVADAGRTASSVAMAAEPAIDGWIRMLTPPSCGRCAALAGQFHTWDEDFERHPACDCLQIGSVGNTAKDLTTDPKLYFDSLTAADQDKYFGKGQAEAIRLGGDIDQVITAARATGGVSVPGLHDEGRLMPAAIIRQGRGDRDKTVELLKRYGYLI